MFVYEERSKSTLTSRIAIGDVMRRRFRRRVQPIKSTRDRQVRNGLNVNEKRFLFVSFVTLP